MLKCLKFPRAQVLPEYVFMLVLVVAAVSAMSVYVRRALQAKIYDARGAMIERVAGAYNSSPYAPVTTFSNEYEPYYLQTNTTGISDYQDQDSLTAGGTTGTFLKNIIIGATAADTHSTQLPPKDAR